MDIKGITAFVCAVLFIVFLCAVHIFVVPLAFLLSKHKEDEKCIKKLVLIATQEDKKSLDFEF